MVTIMESSHGSCALFALLLADAIFSQAQTCDYSSDTTSCNYVADAVCDAGTDFCPQNTDCFDCDACQQFNGDCGLCTQNACYFCPSDARCLSRPLSESIWAPVRDVPRSRLPGCLVETDWMRTCEIPADLPYSDPLYSAQEWVFDVMNVQPVWEQGFTGKGVVIRVNDPEGVDATHPELAKNFNEAASCDNYLPPDPAINHHGTAVASVAVGGGNNGQCSVGVAPDATLTACLGPTELTDENAAAFFLDGLPTTHISINSWNFDSCAKKLREGGRFLQDSCPFTDPTEINPCRRCPDLSNPECEDYLVSYCESRYEDDYAGWWVLCHLLQIRYTRLSLAQRLC